MGATSRSTDIHTRIVTPMERPTNANRTPLHHRFFDRRPVAKSRNENAVRMIVTTSNMMAKRPKSEVIEPLTSHTTSSEAMTLRSGSSICTSPSNSPFA